MTEDSLLISATGAEQASRIGALIRSAGLDEGLGSAEVDIAYTGGDTITLEASGTTPIERLRSILRNLDVDSEEVEGLTLNLTYTESTVEVDSDSRPPAGSIQEPPGEPGRVKANTHQHVALWTLRQFLNHHTTDEYANYEDVAAEQYCALDMDQLRAAWGSLFHNKHLLRRRSTDADHGGIRFLYQLTPAGRDEADRLGKPDFGETVGEFGEGADE